MVVIIEPTNMTHSAFGGLETVTNDGEGEEELSDPGLSVSQRPPRYFRDPRSPHPLTPSKSTTTSSKLSSHASARIKRRNLRRKMTAFLAKAAIEGATRDYLVQCPNECVLTAAANARASRARHPYAAEIPQYRYGAQFERDDRLNDSEGSPPRLASETRALKVYPSVSIPPHPNR